MGSRFFLVAALSLPLAACSWGFESEGDAGFDNGTDDGGGGGGDDDAGDAPGEPDADLSVCDSTELTYASFAQGFMDTYCLGCHSNTLNPAQRRGAPEAVNFDSYELVLEQASRIRFRAGENQDMPPNSVAQPDNEERESMIEWIDCGLRQ